MEIKQLSKREWFVVPVWTSEMTIFLSTGNYI